MNKGYAAFLFILLQYVTYTKEEDIQALGCWRDSNRIRALPSLEKTHHFLDGPYKKRTDPVKKCGQVAIDHGYPIFGIQNGGQCFAGVRGDKRYNMYGPSNLCKDGKGGPWSNSVYSTKTSYGRSFHHAIEPSPWDPYCSRDLDIIILLDSSGSFTKRNKERWEEIKNFVLKFMKGFDDKTRIGIIQYGSDPQIIVDLFQPKKTIDEIKERLDKIKMAGGPRTLNDALKRTWREQLKISNRTAADKVVIAMTTGDVSYGLYGSSQFLSDHDVRVIALGLDKAVHYEFLQSVASYRDVSNIFSVNSGQLLDVVPFIYRDVCNTMPEYVLATSPRPSRPLETTMTTNYTNKNNETKSDSSSKGREDIPRGQLPVYVPRSAYPSLIRGHLVSRMLENSSSDIGDKKNLVTAIKKGAAKEDVASMVLVNPSPELNLDLTEQEANEIRNRDKNSKSLFNNDTFENSFPQPAESVLNNNTVTNLNNLSNFNNEQSSSSSSDADQEQAESLSSQDQSLKNSLQSTSKVTSNPTSSPTDQSSAHSLDYDQSDAMYNKQKPPGQIIKDRSVNTETMRFTNKPTTSTKDKNTAKVPDKDMNFNQRDENTDYHQNNLITSNGTNNYKLNSNSSSKNSYNLPNKNSKNPINSHVNNQHKFDKNSKESKSTSTEGAVAQGIVKINEALNSLKSENDDKEDSDDNDNDISEETNAVSHQNQSDQEKDETEEKENSSNSDEELSNNKQSHSEHSLSNSNGKTSPANTESLSNQQTLPSSQQTYQGKGVKGSDSKINGVGAVSQTLELHSGNNKKIHVSPHHVEHKSLFSGKLSERLRMHPMFGGRAKITTTPDSSNDETVDGTKPKLAFRNLTGLKNSTNFIDNAGKELAEIYEKVHHLEDLNNDVSSFKENKKNKTANIISEKSSNYNKSIVEKGNKPTLPKTKLNTSANVSTVLKNKDNFTLVMEKVKDSLNIKSEHFTKKNKTRFVNVTKTAKSVFDMDKDDRSIDNDHKEAFINLYQPTSSHSTSSGNDDTDKMYDEDRNSYDDLGADNTHGVRTTVDVSSTRHISSTFHPSIHTSPTARRFEPTGKGNFLHNGSIKVDTERKGDSLILFGNGNPEYKGQEMTTSNPTTRKLSTTRKVSTTRKLSTTKYMSPPIPTHDNTPTPSKISTSVPNQNVNAVPFNHPIKIEGVPTSSFQNNSYSRESIQDNNDTNLSESEYKPINESLRRKENNSVNKTITYKENNNSAARKENNTTVKSRNEQYKPTQAKTAFASNVFDNMTNQVNNNTKRLKEKNNGIKQQSNKTFNPTKNVNIPNTNDLKTNNKSNTSNYPTEIDTNQNDTNNSSTKQNYANVNNDKSNKVTSNDTSSANYPTARNYSSRKLPKSHSMKNQGADNAEHIGKVKNKDNVKSDNADEGFKNENKTVKETQEIHLKEGNQIYDNTISPNSVLKGVGQKASFNENSSRNSSEPYTYTLQNITTMLGMPEPRLRNVNYNNNKVKNHNNTGSVLESRNNSSIVISDRKNIEKEFSSGNHVATDDPENTDEISSKKTIKKTDKISDVGSLVSAVADVSRDAEELSDEASLVDSTTNDRRIYHVEDIAGSDYNEGFINSQNDYDFNEFGEKLNKKSLQERKHEIDRLLKILDKEDEEKLYIEKNHLYRKNSQPNVETAQTRELKETFNKINGNKRKFNKIVTQHLSKDEAEQEAYDYDVDNNHDKTPMKGKIKLHGHKLNFISEIGNSKDKNNDHFDKYNTKQTKESKFENDIPISKARNYNSKESSNIDANGDGAGPEEEKTNDEESQPDENAVSLLRFKPTKIDPDPPPIDHNHAFNSFYQRLNEKQKEIQNEKSQRQQKQNSMLKSYENHVVQLAGINPQTSLNQYGKKHNINSKNEDVKLYNKYKTILEEKTKVKPDKDKRYENILKIISKLVDAIQPVRNTKTSYENDQQIGINVKRANPLLHSNHSNTAKIIGNQGETLNKAHHFHPVTIPVKNISNSASNNIVKIRNKFRKQNQTAFPVKEKIKNNISFLPRPLQKTFNNAVKQGNPVSNPFKPILGKPKFQESNPVPIYHTNHNPNLKISKTNQLQQNVRPGNKHLSTEQQPLKPQLPLKADETKPVLVLSKPIFNAPGANNINVGLPVGETVVTEDTSLMKEIQDAPQMDTLYGNDVNTLLFNNRPSPTFNEWLKNNGNNEEDDEDDVNLNDVSASHVINHAFAKPSESSDDEDEVNTGDIVERFTQPMDGGLQDQLLMNLNPLSSKVDQGYNNNHNSFSVKVNPSEFDIDQSLYPPHHKHIYPGDHSIINADNHLQADGNIYYPTYPTNEPVGTPQSDFGALQVPHPAHPAHLPHPAHVDKPKVHIHHFDHNLNQKYGPHVDLHEVKDEAELGVPFVVPTAVPIQTVIKPPGFVSIKIRKEQPSLEDESEGILDKRTNYFRTIEELPDEDLSKVSLTNDKEKDVAVVVHNTLNKESKLKERGHVYYNDDSNQAEITKKRYPSVVAFMEKKQNRLKLQNLPMDLDEQSDDSRISRFQENQTLNDFDTDSSMMNNENNDVIKTNDNENNDVIKTNDNENNDVIQVTEEGKKKNNTKSTLDRVSNNKLLDQTNKSKSDLKLSTAIVKNNATLRNVTINDAEREGLIDVVHAAIKESAKESQTFIQRKQREEIELEKLHSSNETENTDKDLNNLFQKIHTGVEGTNITNNPSPLSSRGTNVTNNSSLSSSRGDIMELAENSTMLRNTDVLDNNTKLKNMLSNGTKVANMTTNSFVTKQTSPYIGNVYNSSNVTRSNTTASEFQFTRVPKLLQKDIDTSTLRLPTKQDYASLINAPEFTHMLPHHFKVENFTSRTLNDILNKTISNTNTPSNTTVHNATQVTVINNMLSPNSNSSNISTTNSSSLVHVKTHNNTSTRLKCNHGSEPCLERISSNLEKFHDDNLLNKTTDNATLSIDNSTLPTALSDLGQENSTSMTNHTTIGLHETRSIDNHSIELHDATAANGNLSSEQMSPLEYMLGCTKPLRVLYAIDVSDGLGAGPLRTKRWNRLKQFIDNINKDVLHRVRQHYMVYNIEPRFISSLSGCDKETEYFMTADDCLCGDYARDDIAGCSVNAPTHDESVEDWGSSGPRTGHALEKARKLFFAKDLNKFKNVIFLISHKESSDELENAENNLKKEGISLVDIELGDRHDLRRRSYIPHHARNYVHHMRYRIRRNSNDEGIPDQHKMKVSLKKLQATLRNIVGKVCKANTEDETKKSIVSKHHVT